jgi:hypothetical protein
MTRDSKRGSTKAPAKSSMPLVRVSFVDHCMPGEQTQKCCTLGTHLCVPRRSVFNSFPRSENRTTVKEQFSARRARTLRNSPVGRTPNS